MNKERQISDLESTSVLSDEDLFIVQSGKKGMNITFADIKDAIADTAFNNLGTGIGYHNSRFRGINLGSSITEAQNTAIQNRTYDGIFIGDYWYIDSIYWVVASVDYYYNIGNTNYRKGNVLVVPKRNLYTAQMHNTQSGEHVSGMEYNITTNGYSNSDGFSTNLSTAYNIAVSAFGSHVSSHQIYCTSVTNNGVPTGGDWRTSNGVELMNANQVFGNTLSNRFDIGSQKMQLPLMMLDPTSVNTRETYWLQDTVDSTSFGVVLSSGVASSMASSNVCGIRPVVTLSYV